MVPKVPPNQKVEKSMKNKIIIWPKGNFTVQVFLPKESLLKSLNDKDNDFFKRRSSDILSNNDSEFLESKSTVTFSNKDSVSLALRISWYFLFHFERNWITLDEWRILAVQKLRLSDEFAYFIFTVATTLDNKQNNERCNFLNIALVLGFQSSQDSREEKRDSVNFVKNNLGKIFPFKK